MTERDKILSFLEQRKSELFSEYQLIRIGLFGSFARNEATEDSDIDLLVEFEPDTENLSEKSQGLNLCGRSISVGKNISSLISNLKFLNLLFMSEKDKANLLAILDSCSKIKKFTEEIWDADSFLITTN